MRVGFVRVWVVVMIGVVMTLAAQPALAAAPIARIEISAGKNFIDTSTWTAGSFEVHNESTGGQQITQVRIDASTTALPEIVFDPDGTAGDLTAKGFTADSGKSATGQTTHSFSDAYSGGYHTLTVNFNDFGSGESFSFSADMDPTSITGVPAPGPGDSGSISGLELVGATVSVTFDGSTTISGTLYNDGSNGGSYALLTWGPPSTPTLSGVSSPSTVNTANQQITVSGPANADVELLLLEGAFYQPNPPVDTQEPYEVNSVIHVRRQSVTLNGSGQATASITLRDSETDGGYNYILAVTEGSGDKVSETSNVIILEYDQSHGGGGPDAGITVSDGGGISVAEAGETTGTFTLTADSAPSANVTVPLFTNGECTLNPAPATLPAGSTTPVEVTVQAVDDAVDEADPHTCQIYTGNPSSDDNAYDNLDQDDVDNLSADVSDDDTSAILLDAGDGVSISEAGGTDSFTLAAATEPQNDVTIPLSTDGQCTVDPETVILSSTTPVEVTVQAVDDAVDEANPHTCQITTGTPTSDDDNYAGLDVADVSASVADDDATIDPGPVTVTVDAGDGLRVSEAGSTDTFILAAQTAPAADITVTLGSDAQCALSVNEVTLGSTNPVEVTVQAVNDAVDEADEHPCAITLSVEGDSILTTESLSAAVIDDDSAGLEVAPGALTLEEGQQAAITVALTSAPTGTVEVSASADTSDLTASPAVLTFTAANWDQPQQISLTAVDDGPGEGDEALTVTLSASGTENYASVAEPVSVQLSEVPNLLANAGFESSLNTGADWRLRGDAQRFTPPAAYLNEGDHILLITADGSLANAAQQTISGVDGSQGDTITLSFDYGTLGLSADGRIGARLILSGAGTQVITCEISERSPSGWAAFTCEATATIDYDTIIVQVGARRVSSGYLGIDQAALFVR